jgi:hypothetical protein
MNEADIAQWLRTKTAPISGISRRTRMGLLDESYYAALSFRSVQLWRHFRSCKNWCIMAAGHATGDNPRDDTKVYLINLFENRRRGGLEQVNRK